jgi:hypothetical protein
LSKVGDGASHLELDGTIVALPIYHRVFPGNHFRPTKTQRFELAIKELTAACAASGMNSVIGLNASMAFWGFPQTIDHATGLERPYASILLMICTIGSGGLSLSLENTADFSGPVGPVYGTPSDYDPIAGASFMGSYDGLLTSMKFGWSYNAGSGVVLTSNVTIKNVDLIVIPGS